MGSIQNRKMWWVGAIVLSFGLSACVDGTDTPTSKTPTTPVAKASGKTTEVSAPEIFSATDRAVWDGRPTLGGIWVAHERADTPSRVVITNTANGATIEGALWSKSKGLPGPAFTISSDLAEALKMQAGVPSDIKVVAMKLVPVEAPKPQETEEIAATTLDAAEADKPQEEVKVSSSTKEVEARDAVVSAEAEAPKKEEKKNFSLFKKKEKPVEPVVTAAVAEEKPAAEPAKGSSFAQVGLFSEKANAEALVKKLNAQKIGGRLIEGKNSKGKPFWRVLAGPASTKSAEAKLLSDVKALGFKDAYLVKG